MPETKAFPPVRAAVPVALVCEQDPAPEAPSAKEPAEILTLFVIAFLYFLQQLLLVKPP